MTDDYNPNLWRGPYIPFKNPFHVDAPPTHMIEDDPQIGICFNEDYLPYLQGAIKALASELSFEGQRDDVRAWVQQMMDLLLVDPIACPVPLDAVNWYINVVDRVYQWRFFWYIPTNGEPDYRRVYACNVASITNGIDVVFEGNSDSSGSEVGGIWKQFKIVSPDGSFQQYHLEWVTCEDVYHTLFLNQREYTLTDLEAKAIHVYADGPIVLNMTMEIFNSYTCGLA